MPQKPLSEYEVEIPRLSARLEDTPATKNLFRRTNTRLSTRMGTLCLRR